jgi:hypothetical protein
MSTVKISQLTENSPTTNRANTIFVGVNLQTSVTGSYTLEQIFQLSDAYAQAAFLKANTPSSVANSAGNFANGAFLAANSGATFANASFIAANASYLSQNTTASFANGAFLTANASYASQNTTATFANAAFTRANSGYGQANSAASFANGAFVTANASYNKANSNALFANGAFVTANASYASQNTTASFANGAFVTANASYESQNTTASFANGAFVRANSAYATANAALANTSGATFGGDLTITGNTTVTGYIEPQKGFVYTPTVYPSAQTAITINMANNSVVRAQTSAGLVVTLSNLFAGKEVMAWITNTSGLTQTFTHGVSALNSSVNATTYGIPGTSTILARYMSIDGTTQNTFVAITHA